MIRGIAQPGLVSVGYEGRTLDELLDALVAAGVDLLVDVRLTPLSRKPGLSRRRLEAALAERGIGYRHARALGNPKENREPFRRGDLDRGRAVFKTLLAQDMATRAVAEIAEAGRRGRVAVLCFERDHESCHRQVVVEQALTQMPKSRQTVAYA
jgi:uncharacterized protein (DUF488 family)